MRAWEHGHAGLGAYERVIRHVGAGTWSLFPTTMNFHPQYHVLLGRYRAVLRYGGGFAQEMMMVQFPDASRELIAKREIHD